MLDRSFVLALLVGSGAISVTSRAQEAPGHAVVGPAETIHVLHPRHAAHCQWCVEDEECIAGVVKHEAPDKFPGNGFVARKNPELPCLHTFERAGRPDQISPHAIPSYGPSYAGYYVGGGSVSGHHGTLPGPADGTFGVDYHGQGLLRHRVALLFNHGAKFQDGTGHYQPDPRKEIPNVFAIKYGERIHRLIGHGGEAESAPE